MNYKELIGKKIRVNVNPEGTFAVGEVKDVLLDTHGDTELIGTWGNFTIHPEFDKFEIIQERIGDVKVYDEWLHTSIS